MAFISTQFQHDLIPQAHSPENDFALVGQIADFRNSMFQLFQQKIAETTAAHPEIENQEPLYRQVRHDLDRCPDIMTAHRRRGEWQDRLWASVLKEIEGDRSRLERVYTAHQQGDGGLELNPDLEIPLHQRKTHIHRMPGGYTQDLDEDDFWTGLLYDHGVFLYGRGWFGPLNDELGQTLIHQFLAAQYPEFQPRRILDLGCSVGHSTLPYASAFPQAQMWGVDLGASLLRYASARSRVLGQTVYFAQQNAEHLEFADQSFDLVVSHILMHEIPGAARQRVFAESYRLLKPGGLMVHLENQLFLEPPSLVARYFRDTEVWANSEPFLASSQFAEFPHYALAAGFAPEAFHIHRVPSHSAVQAGDTTPRWIVFCGEKR